MTLPPFLTALLGWWWTVLSAIALALWVLHETQSRTVPGTTTNPDPQTVPGPVPGNADRAPAAIEPSSIDLDRRAL